MLRPSRFKWFLSDWLGSLRQHCIQQVDLFWTQGTAGAFTFIGAFFKDRTATLSFKQVTSVIQISIKGWFTVKNKKTKRKTWKKTVHGNDLARLFNSPTLKILGLLVLYATTLPLSNICYLEVSLQGTVHLLHFLRGYSRGCSRAMTLLHNIGHLLCGSKQNKWEILKATIKKNNN